MAVQLLRDSSKQLVHEFDRTYRDALAERLTTPSTPITPTTPSTPVSPDPTTDVPTALPGFTPETGLRGTGIGGGGDISVPAFDTRITLGPQRGTLGQSVTTTVGEYLAPIGESLDKAAGSLTTPFSSAYDAVMSDVRETMGDRGVDTIKGLLGGALTSGFNPITTLASGITGLLGPEIKSGLQSALGTKGYHTLSDIMSGAGWGTLVGGLPGALIGGAIGGLFGGAPDVEGSWSGGTYNPAYAGVGAQTGWTTGSYTNVPAGTIPIGQTSLGANYMFDGLLNAVDYGVPFGPFQVRSGAHVPGSGGVTVGGTHYGGKFGYGSGGNISNYGWGGGGNVGGISGGNIGGSWGGSGSVATGTTASGSTSMTGGSFD